MIIDYCIVGIICFVFGVFSGMITLGLCIMSSDKNDSTDACHGCFGASFGDCDHCTKKGEKNV